MSYALAYTTHFRSLDNTLWNIDIYINGYSSRPLEICLEGDEPCVIEWQETGKMDVVQSSTCTLRVSNENDRQMVQLMNRPDAAVLVSRNGKWYWWGHLDDAIYEEPYSFKKAYVTELTFSDFGILNRIPFTLTGKQSVGDIVRDCLDSIGFGNGATIYLYTSLLEPKTQQPITLDMLYINADRFEAKDESWDAMTSKREVLEEILRPLGLRIMQKNAQIYIYDIEYLRNPDNWCWNYIVWKGTDAYLKGSETFGWYEVAFEPDADETLAETRLNLEDYTVDDRFWAQYYDEDLEEWDKGYYIRFPSVAALNSNGRVFKTRSGLSSSDDIGYAWRVWCYDKLNGGRAVLGNRIVRNIALAPGNTSNTPVAEALFKIETDYLPICPDLADYQMRVNLDLLLSPKRNPMEADADWNFDRVSSTVRPTTWKKYLLQVYVPVKLELLDEQGNVLMHYKNAGYDYYPLDPGKGQWLAGAASSFGDMLLAYYNDGLEETALGGWVTNRQTMNVTRKYMPSLYKKRENGEYVPLPPSAGIIRLTVSNCVFSPKMVENQVLFNFEDYIRWHLLRNAKITLVKANCKDDGIDKDTVYERDMISLYSDHLKETVKAGCWRKGIAPSARGLFFTANGIVWEKFIKNGRARTLEEHRLRCLEDQTFYVQPVLSGTAELDIQFCAKREESTSGVFLVTALRQDLRQDTEEVTMARIANEGGFVYEFTWSDPYCVEEEEPYTFVWSNPVCAQEPGPYKFAWSNPTCVKQYSYSLEWEEMQTYY